jgi:hypothetical protein
MSAEASTWTWIFALFCFKTKGVAEGNSKEDLFSESVVKISKRSLRIFTRTQIYIKNRLLAFSTQPFVLRKYERQCSKPSCSSAQSNKDKALDSVKFIGRLILDRLLPTLSDYLCELFIHKMDEFCSRSTWSSPLSSSCNLQLSKIICSKVLSTEVICDWISPARNSAQAQCKGFRKIGANVTFCTFVKDGDSKHVTLH